jgi:hypothetical protein
MTVGLDDRLPYQVHDHEGLLPSASMFLTLQIGVGNADGTVKASSPFWETQFDYVRVTQGATVVFNDDFD